ncbi:MAG: hypothetical protein ACUVTQ_00465 [Desulfotomaculales bacterium]
MWRWWGEGRQGLPPRRMIWLVGAGLLGIALLVLGNLGGRSGRPAPEQKGEGPDLRTNPTGEMRREEEALAASLQALLTQVRGVGEVRVAVRLEGSTESDFAVNTVTGNKTTQEKNRNGGSRTITEVSNNDQVVLVRDGRGQEVPVVERERAPRVAGVLVVAEGAADPQVRLALFRAVEVALAVPPHKIIVLPRERKGEP